MNDATTVHDRWLPPACVALALPSFVLSAWMLASPDAFWRAVGLAGNPFAQAIYAGAIAGEGFMFARCAMHPLRYRVFFEYMVVYKTLACLGAIRVVLAMHDAPFRAWLVIGGWASAGVICAAILALTRPAREAGR